MTRLIKLYDTTLRDGSQGEGVAFSMEDKVRIAHRLDAMGIHYIEGGWPGSNPKDLRFFKRVQGAVFKVARISAFGSSSITGFGSLIAAMVSPFIPCRTSCVNGIPSALRAAGPHLAKSALGSGPALGS